MDITLTSKIKDKIFTLYFHNDPLSMNGSKTSNERLNLLISLDKIVFVSKWVQDRFFIDLDRKLSDKTEIVYPSIHKINRINNLLRFTLLKIQFHFKI